MGQRNVDAHLTRAWKPFGRGQNRSSSNAGCSIHSLMSALSVSGVELLYRKRPKAATARVQAQQFVMTQRCMN